MPIIKLLLVEDELSFGTVLSDTLELRNMHVTWAKDGDEGLQLVRKQEFDVAILDVMLPKMSGFELAKQIQNINPDLPFIFLTAKGLKEDQIQGFKLGASDYITKPFEPEILVLRIQAALRKQVNTMEEVVVDKIEFDEFTFLPASRKLVTGSNEEKRLSPKEAAILLLLLQHQNSVVTRETALMRIWGEDTYFTSRSMDVYITKLRKYFQTVDNVKIENVHGTGFMLVV